MAINSHTGKRSMNEFKHFVVNSAYILKLLTREGFIIKIEVRGGRLRLLMAGKVHDFSFSIFFSLPKDDSIGKIHLKSEASARFFFGVGCEGNFPSALSIN